MLRSQWMAFGLIILLILGPVRVNRAQEDWIQPGSYIDWPENLKGEPTLPRMQSSRTVPVSYYSETEEVSFDEPGYLYEAPYYDSHSYGGGSNYQVSTYGWELLPEGLLYHSYLAGEKEPRFAAQWLWDRERGLVWESALGGRWGVVRHGTSGPNGEGFQFDVEGAALARVDPEEESDLEAVDFRAGLIGTWRKGPWRWKAGYYHISSHVGDEYLIKNPGFNRINYVRDAVLVGLMYDITDDLQVYGEISAALGTNGGAEPMELQFGAQYSPACPTGIRGAPFAAINGHLRQEFDYGGSVNAMAGWAWRGKSNHLFRAGFQHYNGTSMQWSFLDRYENMTGMGIWFDF